MGCGICNLMFVESISLKEDVQPLDAVTSNVHKRL